MQIGHDSDTPDTWAIVSLRGAMDFDHVRGLRKRLLDSVGSRGSVLADLTAVTAIDSAGIACLIEAYRAATKAGARFARAGANRQVMRMLTLNHLDKVLSIDPNSTNQGRRAA